MSPSPNSSRQWPWFLAVLALLAAIVVVVVVKACPPTPAPAGKPAEATPPVVVAPAHVPALPAPAAPVDVKADPK
jgi:hypothetical protein